MIVDAFDRRAKAAGSAAGELPGAGMGWVVMAPKAGSEEREPF